MLEMTLKAPVAAPFPPPPPLPAKRELPDVVPPSPPSEGDIDASKLSDSLLRAFLDNTTMDKAKAMGIPAYAASVDLLAGVVSELPLKLYKQTGDKVEEITDDPRIRLFNGDTGDLIRAPEMFRMFVEDYFNDKGGFIFVNWQGSELKSLHYVDPGAVSVMVDRSTHIFKRALFMVDGQLYYPWQFIYACRNARDGVTGQSIINQATQPLSTAYATLQYEQALMQRGGNKRGYLKSQNKISQETVDALKKGFSRMYSNANSENIVVLNAGMEFQEASETSVEMQLAENKRSNADDIMSLFLIPPPLIRGGADEDDHKNFVNYKLQPLLEIIRTAINHASLLESEKADGYYWDFDLKEFTKASMRERWQAWATAKKNGLVNADEFREFENLPPLGLDYINLGLNDVLADPRERKIIVPNMGVIMDLDTGQVTKQSTDDTQPSNSTSDQSEGGDKSGDQGKQ